MSLFVKFDKEDDDTWLVVDTFEPGNKVVAVIRWSDDWERYVLYPAARTAWEEETLADVIKFLKLRTLKRNVPDGA